MKRTILFFVVAIFGILPLQSNAQKWKYGKEDTYDGRIYYAMLTSNKAFSSELACLVVNKSKNGVNIYIIGSGKDGNWCKAGFKFDDGEKIEFDIDSINQNEQFWGIKDYRSEIVGPYNTLIKKLKKSKFVFVRLYCHGGETSPDYVSSSNDYKFILTGSSNAINYVFKSNKF